MSEFPCQCWCHREGEDCRQCDVDPDGVTHMPCPVCSGKGLLVQEGDPSYAPIERCEDCAGTGRRCLSVGDLAAPRGPRL